MRDQAHESYSRHEAAVPGSNRSFGIVMAAAFALLTLINVWHVERAWPWTGALAGLFFVLACLCPAALRPLNWIWFKFGLPLHKVVSPIVMALVFFGTVLPTGFIMRVLGKDPPRLNCWEIARYGANVLLVLPDGPEALAHAIATLMNDRDMSIRFGRQIVVAEFSSTQIGSEMIALYTRLLTETTPSDNRVTDRVVQRD